MGWRFLARFIITRLALRVLSDFDLLINHDLDANNRLCPVHNIQAYFSKFALTDVSNILTLVNFSRSKSNVTVKVIFGLAFQKLKYEAGLKSVTIRSEVGVYKAFCFAMVALPGRQEV